MHNVSRAIPTIATAMLLFGFAVPSSADLQQEENGNHSLEIPGKGLFQAIEISFSSWEGDREGISLQADGSLRTWSFGHSGMTGQYPSGEMIWSLPSEKVDKLVRMLALPRVLSDSAVKPHTDSKSTKSVNTTRLVTTTEGTFKLTSSEDAMEVEALLNKMRFFMPGKGILEWLQIKAKQPELRNHYLRLTSDGVLVKQPRKGKKVRVRQGWFVPETEVFALIDSIEDTPFTKAKNQAEAHVVTDEGHFNLKEAVDELHDTLMTFHQEQAELQIDPKRRFERIVLSVNRSGMNVYFLEIDATGLLMAGVDAYPEIWPFEIPGGREEMTLATESVYEIVRFLKKPGIRKMITPSIVKIALPEDAEMEIQLVVKKRDENPAIFEDNIEVYQYQESASLNLKDPKRLVEKFLIRLYKELKAKREVAGENEEDVPLEDSGETIEEE